MRFVPEKIISELLIALRVSGKRQHTFDKGGRGPSGTLFSAQGRPNLKVPVTVRNRKKQVGGKTFDRGAKNTHSAFLIFE